MVTSAFGSSFAPPCDEPKHAVSGERQGCGQGAAGEPATQVSGHGDLLVTGRALPGLAMGVGRCRRSSSRAAVSAVWRAPASTGPSRTPASSSRGRAGGQRAELVGDRGRGAARRPRRATDPDSTTSVGSRTATMAAIPSANRWPSVGEQLVAGARRASGRLATAAGGGGRAEAERAGQREHRRAAGELLERRRRCPRRTSRTSGVPGSGRKPTSPAPPVAPPWSRPSMTIAAPEALVGPQQHEVVDASGPPGPRARRPRRG